MSFTNLEWFTIYLSFFFCTFLFFSNACYVFFLKRNQVDIVEVSYLASIWKPLMSIKRNGISYALGWIPLTAYVKPKGIEEENNPLLFKVLLNTFGVFLLIFLASITYLSVKEAFTPYITLNCKIYDLILGNLDAQTFRTFYLSEMRIQPHYFAILFTYTLSILLVGNLVVLFQKMNTVLGTVSSIALFLYYIMILYRLKVLLSFNIVLFFLLTQLVISSVYFGISVLLINNTQKSN